MWLLLLPSALADDVLTTCDYGDSLWNIIGIAKRQPGPVNILLDTDCTIDVETIELSPGTGGVTEYTLKPVATTGRYLVPPISVSGGVTVHLERIEVASTSQLGSGAVLDELFETPPGIAIHVDASTLDVSDVALVGAGGAGIVVVDGTLEGEGLEASGFDAFRPLYAVGNTARTTVALVDVTFSANGAGAVTLWGAGNDVDASFTTAAFYANGPAAGADLRSVDVASLVVRDATFTNSEGLSNDGSSDGAPVLVDGGSLTCTRCDFTGTSGEVASTIAAYLGGGDALVLDEGTYAPADATTRLMHVDSGGRFEARLITVRGGGSLVRYAGTTTMTSSRFEADGRLPDREAIKLVSTTATLEGLTMCDFRSNGWGLIGAFGSTVALTDSVLQNLALNGDPVLKAWDTMGSVGVVVEDNTMVGSDAVLVGGAPASLTFTNNLVAASTGGLALDDMPGGADIAYNLWHDVDDPVAGGVPDATDVVDEDPRFVDGFSPTVCGSGPWLKPGSPANAAGDPSRGDLYGNPRSDIGAVDYDEGGDTGGGDTGGHDTGGGDTDGHDTATPDTGTPDADPPDDTGAPRLVGGALPPCGCGDDAPAAALLLLLPLLTRRRRA